MAEKKGRVRQAVSYERLGPLTIYTRTWGFTPSQTAQLLSDNVQTHSDWSGAEEDSQQFTGFVQQPPRKKRKRAGQRLKQTCNKTIYEVALVNKLTDQKCPRSEALELKKIINYR